MKPPPPMLPAGGYVTAIANAVATAASTALPTFLRISTPASAPGVETATTTPLRYGSVFRVSPQRHKGRKERNTNIVTAALQAVDFMAPSLSSSLCPLCLCGESFLQSAALCSAE